MVGDVYNHFFGSGIFGDVGNAVDSVIDLFGGKSNKKKDNNAKIKILRQAIKKLKE